MNWWKGGNPAQTRTTSKGPIKASVPGNLRGSANSPSRFMKVLGLNSFVGEGHLDVRFCLTFTNKSIVVKVDKSLDRFSNI